MAQTDHDTTDTTLEEIADNHPLTTALGSHAKTRFLAALLANHPQPLNITQLVDAAGLSDRHTWYDHADDLEASGLITYPDTTGPATDVALTDSEATHTLQALADHVNANRLDTRTDA